MSLCSTQRQCTLHMPAHTGAAQLARHARRAEQAGRRMIMAHGTRRSAQSMLVAYGGSLRRYSIREARIQSFFPDWHAPAESTISRPTTSSAAHVPMRSCEADEREQADQCTRGGGLAGSHAALRGVEWWWVGVMGWLRSAEKWMGASRVRGPCIGEGAGRKCGGVGRHGRRRLGLCAGR